MNIKSIGDCPICDRSMVENRYINRHHLIPKCKAGAYTDQITLHTICHNKIHSVWSETELSQYFHTVERIRGHQDIRKFIKWIANKPPDFYSKTKRSNGKRR